MPDRLANVYGLRLIDRFGWENLLRGFVGLVWILIVVQVITDFRPDLVHPADFGSDTSNYAAAGERLTESSLYGMSPSDRPVSVDNPPDWTVPPRVAPAGRHDLGGPARPAGRVQVPSALEHRSRGDHRARSVPGRAPAAGADARERLAVLPGRRCHGLVGERGMP